eukprot:156943-Chlamydomonas_euryale.AAC.3
MERRRTVRPNSSEMDGATYAENSRAAMRLMAASVRSVTPSGTALPCACACGGEVRIKRWSKVWGEAGDKGGG